MVATSIFQRTRRGAQQTLQQGQLYRDVSSYAELQSAISAHLRLTTNATTGEKSGGVVARLVKSFAVPSTITLIGGANGANGFEIHGSRWARLLVNTAIDTLFDVQADGVKLYGIVVKVGTGGSLATFVHGTVRASSMVITRCDVSATAFFTLGASCFQAEVTFNRTHAGTITTSASSGSNVIVGNFNTAAGATITSAATDAVGLNT